MIVEKHISIEGNHKLSGEINVKGAKNAVLKEMILPILAEGKSVSYTHLRAHETP